MIQGQAHIFGDNINTDYIIAGKYTKTLDHTVWVEHLFEDISPGSARRYSLGILLWPVEILGAVPQESRRL